MSVNLSIKGVPEEVAQKLRERAERHHRSLQGELMAIVSEAAMQPAPAAAPTRRGGIDAGTRVGWRSTEDIWAEMQQRFPGYVDKGPSAVDIIRADRDSR